MPQNSVTAIAGFLIFWIRVREASERACGLL